jgi:hypothetical protein
MGCSSIHRRPGLVVPLIEAPIRSVCTPDPILIVAKRGVGPAVQYWGLLIGSVSPFARMLLALGVSPFARMLLALGVCGRLFSSFDGRAPVMGIKAPAV